jgi:ribosome-binding factor A
MTDRMPKVSNLVKELTAKFLASEANRTSLITVTGANVSPDMKKATVFITVLPEDKEEQALQFAKRQRGEIREYLKKHMTTKVVPFIEIVIDKGEKNRQKIDELLREK